MRRVGKKAFWAVWSGILWLGGVPAFAQTTLGTEFWFVFLDNYQLGQSQLQVYISSISGAQGTVSIPALGWTQNFAVPPLGNVLITLPSNAILQPVHVVATDTIAVWALNFQPYTSDATVVLPVQALGTEYVVLSYSDGPGGAAGSYPPQLAVLAIANNTQVEIIPPGQPPINITLNAGQVWSYTNSSGVSGTIVRVVNTNPAECKPIAVFAGARCVSVCTTSGFTCCCDHIYEQMLPVNSWGTEFVVVPFAGRNFDYVRIAAYFNNTQVFVNGAPQGVLNQGQWMEITINTPVYIQTSQPVMVAQYSVSGNCDGTTGDPFFIVIPPLEQRMSDIIFEAFVFNVINSYWVNVVVPANGVNSVWLNGNPIGAQFQPVPTAPQWSYARIPVQQGTHRLRADSGAIISIYGFGNWDSYGYLAGSMVRSWIEIVMADSFVCPGDSVKFYYVLHSGGGNVSVSSPTWILSTGDTVFGDTAVFYIPALDTYTVQFSFISPWNSCQLTELTFVVDEGDVPDLSPVRVCARDSVLLWADTTYPGPYIWSTGDTAPYISVWIPMGPDTLLYEVIYPQVCNDRDTVWVWVHQVYMQWGSMGETPLCAFQDSLYLNIDSTWGGRPPYAVVWTPLSPALFSSCPDTCLDTWVWGSDTGFIVVQVTDSLGCQAMDTIEIPILPPGKLLTLDSGACMFQDTFQPTIVTENLYPPYQVQWTSLTGGTLVCDTCFPPSLVLQDSTGVFVVFLEDSFGCTVTDTIVFQGYPLPQFTLKDTWVCWHDSLYLTLSPAGDPPYQVIWFPPERVECSACLQTWTRPYSSDYSLVAQVINTYGCVWTDTLWVLVDTGPRVQALQDTIIPQGDTAVLTALTDALWFGWILPGGVQVDTAETLRVSPSPPGDVFWLFGISERGCWRWDSVWVRVFVPECTGESAVFVPNVFTPNGDGVNDVLYVYILNPDARILRWSIYNRWGEEMFRLEDTGILPAPPFRTLQGWDGTFRGTFVRPDVYVYYLEYECGGEIYTRKGDVTVIR